MIRVDVSLTGVVLRLIERRNFDLPKFDVTVAVWMHLALLERVLRDDFRNTRSMIERIFASSEESRSKRFQGREIEGCDAGFLEECRQNCQRSSDDACVQFHGSFGKSDSVM